MGERPIIVWFRQDLRIGDHVALRRAVEAKAGVIPLFVFDEVSSQPWSMGGASLWWLHHSLTELGAGLSKRGSKLILKRGAAVACLVSLAKKTNAQAVYASRMYEPWAVALENEINTELSNIGVDFKRFPGSLLFEPEAVATKSGTPFKVYTPFWRALLAAAPPRTPLRAPKKITAFEGALESDDLDEWALLPTKPDWSGGMRAAWKPGETHAKDRLTVFLDEAVADYADKRNRPDVAGTSCLSPHLHFGEMSPSAVWHAVAAYRDSQPSADKGCEVFLKELVWREFCAHLLFHYPILPTEPFRSEFAAFGWENDHNLLQAWQKGQTGYPIVDAGMRELWTTGWMHNRVRMIAASFLTKHLLIPWQAGEAWFWDTLVDADLANNAAGWQWVSGSGADAAPYFRIFNPVTQGQKFDPEGIYVRRWVPELAALPTDVIHSPWSAEPMVLKSAGVELGRSYPQPIVDHAAARQRALAAYQAMKG